ncbi:GNAT family N-acetyltransferase [bacterium]|nr:GNAT family N-acetyltransferase [bacterium]
MEIKIRRAQDADVKQVMALLHTTNLIDKETPYNSAEYFMQSCRDGVFLVATYDDKIIGMIHGEMLMGRGCVVWYFVVDEKMRGHGIGRQLFGAFETECKSRGASWLFGSSDINAKTMNFYRKNNCEFDDAYMEFCKNI